MFRRKRMRPVAVIISALLTFAITSNCVSAGSSRGKIDGFSGERSLEEMFSLGQSGSPFYSSDSTENCYEIEARPGEEIRIPLTADMFTWSSGKNPLPMEAVKVKDLVSSRVKVKAAKQSGVAALDYIQIDSDTFNGRPFHPPGAMYPMTGKTACISIMLASELKSVKEQDFQYDIYLSVGGGRDAEQSENMKITLYGTLKNPEYEIYATGGNVDLSDGTVAVAEEFVPNVEIDAGNGVTINRTMIKGKKYYATSAIKNASDGGLDMDYPDIYPGIKMVYRLNTVNMKYGRCLVTIDTKDENVYFVYNDQMEYIGKSNEQLPYSDMYFMSDKEIPTFDQESYLSNLKNLPTEEPLGYSTGEDSEATYLAAEKNIDTFTATKEYTAESDINNYADRLDSIKLLPEYEFFVSKENGIDVGYIKEKIQ